MPPAGRTANCGAREARQRLKTANAYLLAADMAISDERDEFAGVAAGNAVLSGIAASDAMCCKGLGRYSRDQDHRQAAELLATSSAAGPTYKKALIRLLNLKDAAHYGFDGFSRIDAKKAIELARKLVAGADELLQA